MKKKKKVFFKDDALWYKDAVIYELHVKTFCDSNGDGIGDFKGLISKLPYLESLGVTAVWLLPFYPSPLRDDGYDIADYYNIHPAYGTLRDFKEFLTLAHKSGIRVITELVINHTSDQHSWFQKARKAKKGSAARDFYVWNNSPEKYKDARIIFQDFESSNWTWDAEAGAYYWHRFYSHQPDLNFDNPKVHKAIMHALDFWFDLGVDGMRLDAVPYLFEREGTNCENLPETHAFLKKLRSHVDKKYKNRMLLAEANQWPEDAVKYFGDGDECHMAFHFPIMPRMFMAVYMEDKFPITDILDPSMDIPENCQWALFLRNHDELTLEMVTDEERDYMYSVYAQDPRTKVNLGIRRRLAPLLRNTQRKIELMNILLFSLPGTPVIYYGDEIGMGDNYYLGDRDGVRTPMQWSPDRNAGFSKANPQRLYLPLIIEPEYHYEALNVENQEQNLSSLLWWTKRVIGMRKKFKAFSRGSIQFLNTQNPKVLSFIRKYEDEIILVVINLSRFSQVAHIDLSGFKEFVPEEVFSHNEFPVIKEEPYFFPLGSHGYYWFKLKMSKESIENKDKKLLPLIFAEDVKSLFEKEQLENLCSKVLPEYLKSARWFGSKTRVMRSINIVENITLSAKKLSRLNLMIVEVNYSDGLPERYLLPLCFDLKEKAKNITDNFSQSVLANVKIGNIEGVLYDGSFDPGFRTMLLEYISKRKKLKGEKGVFVFTQGKMFKKLLGSKKIDMESHLLGREQSNTSMVYDEAFILKLFRKLEKGLNPDAEIIRVLTEKSSFSNIPSFAGAIEYRKSENDITYTGLMQSFIPNSIDAWALALDNVGKFFERILSRRAEIYNTPSLITIVTEKEALDKMTMMHELTGAFFADMISLLGKRTAEMHLSLAKISDGKDFAPEPFSILYQRSIYQSMRSLLRQVFQMLGKNMDKCPKEIKEEVLKIKQSESEILKKLARVMEKKVSAMKIRIHGDYHLGQVLFTGKDFTLIDFEGEPARPLSERRLKRSPLRDIAGMIRSFHYAAYSGFLTNTIIQQETKSFLKPWVEIWYHYVSSLFLSSYINTAGEASFHPKKIEDFNLLFDAFLLEKAVYELGYELNNRPDWLIIPVRGLSCILKGTEHIQ